MSSDTVEDVKTEAAIPLPPTPGAKAPCMKAIQVPGPGVELQVIEKEIPAIPHPEWVRIKVEACGMCSNDHSIEGERGRGQRCPRIPGHEVVGVIDDVGANVTTWRMGQRVGVGWYGGHCGTCLACRRGHFIYCRKPGITGLTHDGGYAEYMVAPAQSLAAIRDGRLRAEQVAPLMCAGVTVFSALRHSNAERGDIVAIQGVAGLGHLAIQFACKLGYRTAVISRDEESRELALKLGANVYINSAAKNPGDQLRRMGGARVILCTAPEHESLSTLIEGLNDEGKLLIVGSSPQPAAISPVQLVSRRRSVQGWHAGAATESEDALAFAGGAGVLPQVELFPLAEAVQAHKRLLSGESRFHIVLTMNR